MFYNAHRVNQRAKSEEQAVTGAEIAR